MGRLILGEPPVMGKSTGNRLLGAIMLKRAFLTIAGAAMLGQAAAASAAPIRANQSLPVAAQSVYSGPAVSRAGVASRMGGSSLVESGSSLFVIIGIVVVVTVVIAVVSGGDSAG